MRAYISAFVVGFAILITNGGKVAAYDCTQKVSNAVDPIKGYSHELFYQLPLTHTEERIVYKIISTLAEKNVFELLLEKRDLDKKGKRINHIHPLRFLGAIFSNPELKKAMKEVRKNSFKWDGFMGGVKRRMDEESSRNNVIPYVSGFSQYVSADPNTVYYYVQKSDWEGLGKYLVSQ